MFEFQNLEVYKKAKQFNAEIKLLLKSARIDQVSNNQLHRASLSILLNIAEGSGRVSRADRKNFFIIARSSIFESVALLELLKDQHHAFSLEYEKLLNLCDEMSRMLYKMIDNLSEEKPFKSV